LFTLIPVNCFPLPQALPYFLRKFSARKRCIYRMLIVYANLVRLSQMNYERY
jgi:hypothetical protein